MPPLRNKPTCKRCGKQHWNMVACADADMRNEQETRNEQDRRSFIVKLPRPGYREFGDVLEPETERMGQTTFALKREPGQRIGSFRN